MLSDPTRMKTKRKQRRLMSATVKSKEKRNHCSLSSEKRVRSLRCSIDLTKNNNEFNNQLILRHYLCYENSLAINKHLQWLFVALNAGGVSAHIRYKGTIEPLNSKKRKMILRLWKFGIADGKWRNKRHIHARETLSSWKSGNNRGSTKYYNFDIHEIPHQDKRQRFFLISDSHFKS